MEQEFTPWDARGFPYHWQQYNLTILAERYETYTGQRQYVVQAAVKTGLVLSNAAIFGDDEPSYLEQIKGEQNAAN